MTVVITQRGQDWLFMKRKVFPPSHAVVEFPFILYGSQEKCIPYTVSRWTWTLRITRTLLLTHFQDVQRLEGCSLWGVWWRGAWQLTDWPGKEITSVFTPTTWQRQAVSSWAEWWLLCEILSRNWNEPWFLSQHLPDRGRQLRKESLIDSMHLAPPGSAREGRGREP